MPEFFNIKFSFNMSYFCLFFKFNLFHLLLLIQDMAIKPSFKVQNFALVNAN